MSENNRTYIAIDLKSFYASVECVDRTLDPLNTNLVVADESRTDKTICLAVTPSLKKYGIGGRAPLFEVIQRVTEINNQRKMRVKSRAFSRKSVLDTELTEHDDYELDFIIAPPRMAHYIEVSTQIYRIYLKYIAPEDIHVYSIDEVFIDATAYMRTYNMSAHELAMTIIRNVLEETGITATAGIGTNLYLAKVAMDIVAKKIPADEDGVRIAELDEMTYRKELWDYKPISKFWRIGRGIAQKLEPYGIDTMGKLARLSIENEELLYTIFGVNAELLIDHAWGWEPCTIEAIKAYKPESNSFSSGQVLQEPYTKDKALVVIQEMADQMALDLVAKRLVTNQIVLSIYYDANTLYKKDIERLTDEKISTDRYGRKAPKHAHGTTNFTVPTSSSKKIIKAVVNLYNEIVHPNFLIRRLNLTVNHVINEGSISVHTEPTQLDLFYDYEAEEKKRNTEKAELEKERRIQEIQLSIKQRFGKNAILKGFNFKDGATAKERNRQIGGHKA